MSAAAEDEFDVLTFFIIVMGVLTAIVGLFAWLLYGKVEEEAKKIKTEIRNLGDMQTLAIDDKFKGWIQRERDGRTERGSATEFSARILQSAKSFRVDIDRLDPKAPIQRPDSLEKPFNVTIKNTQLEPLTKFLHDVEEKWGGAKVKQMQLNWREKEKHWSAEIVISIFKTNTE